MPQVIEAVGLGQSSPGGEETVLFLLRNGENRRKPFFIFTELDFFDAAELMEGAEVVDVAAREGVLR